MRVLNVTSLPIYLPADTAQLPFGDPITDVTVTTGTPGTIVVAGYNAPAAGDAIAFTFAAGGSIPTGLTAGQTYYVVSPSANSFSVAATKGGSAIAISGAGSSVTAHLLSAQIYGTRMPFKSGDTAVAVNLGSGSVTLQGAPDASAGVPYGNPTGPGTYTAIATVAAGTAALVVLNNDWISLTGSGTLVLLQN